MGRPRQDDPARLLPILNPIWFAAFQPGGSRLQALLPEGRPADEAAPRRRAPALRENLLAGSARPLDRLSAPPRGRLHRHGGTRPGRLLRQRIPIRGPWEEEGAGRLEVDTVALCGGSLEARPAGRLDAADLRTDWPEQRGLENRGQHGPLWQLPDWEASLPFARRGGGTATLAAGSSTPTSWPGCNNESTPCSSPVHGRTASAITRPSNNATGRPGGSTSAANATTIPRWGR